MISEYKNPSEVEMNKIVSAGNIKTRNQALLAGELLKAMDTVACLSAEKHARLPCATLVMDDLEVSDFPSLGQVLNVKARLTRAFGSSMEVVVEAALEDFPSGTKTNICQAYFVFVALAKTGKVKLNVLDPVTIEERLEYALAMERRKIRLEASDEGKAETKSKDADDGQTQPNSVNNGVNTIMMNETGVESIELVLPSHANHHKSTFGGQVMAWLVSVCTIAASRLCHAAPSIISVNGIQFLDQSSVGDRLVFKAMVNKTFDDDSMEVGCRVEASGIEGKTRHINSAYLTFVTFDENKQRKPLPHVQPATNEQTERQRNAVSRRQKQMEKKKILQCVGPALSVPWSKDNSNILAFHNVTAFRKLCQLGNWVKMSQDGKSSLFKCIQDKLQCVKVETSFYNSPQKLFLVLNTTPRAAWDPIITKSQVVNKIDEHDKIVHFVMASSQNSTKEPSDLLLLQSSRPASDKQDDYVIAFRSITWKSFPALEAYSRKENLSSGFLIQECNNDPEKAMLTYINQITDQVAPFLSSDLTGKTKMYARRISKLEKLLTSDISTSGKTDKSC